MSPILIEIQIIIGQCRKKVIVWKVVNNLQACYFLPSFAVNLR